VRLLVFQIIWPFRTLKAISITEIRFYERIKTFFSSPLINMLRVRVEERLFSFCGLERRVNDS
jgi:hypothetical protein